MSQSDYKSRLAHARHERVTAVINSLTVMPTAINVPIKIMQLYRSPKPHGLEQFAEVLIADGPLSAKVLELANSAWFCPPKPVKRVSDALRMIGLNNLLPLLFGMSLAGIFTKVNLPQEERAALWQTSLLKGILAREWARWRKVDQEEEAFLCGVLQDIAMPAIIASDRATAMELAGIVDLADETRAQREASLYGADHCEFGRRICAKMRLPELYQMATASHHARGEDGSGPPLPPEHLPIRGALRFAAAVPHAMTRLDEQRLKRLASVFAQTAPNVSDADFADFVGRAVERGKAIVGMLCAPEELKRGMASFLHEVADQVARTMFAAIGATNRTIEQLQLSHVELEGKLRGLGEQAARADYDALTNVLNRRGFFARADRHLELARMFGMACAVGFIDLDDFKGINDQYGHETGDRALVIFADALRAMMQNRGMIGRCGGDEFVFVLMVSADVGREGVAREIEQAIGNLSIEVGDAQRVPLRGSVGIAWLGMPEEHQDIHAAMRLADQHMYQCKRALKANAA
jgi:diguanylate cyclase (GGDEF)-like protein